VLIEIYYFYHMKYIVAHKKYEPYFLDIFVQIFLENNNFIKQAKVHTN